MRKEYDFSNAFKNPYAKKLKKQLTIKIEFDTLDYFKKISREVDMPYQNLISLYLRQCASEEKKPSIKWK